jgi:hypothetical protein
MTFCNPERDSHFTKFGEMVENCHSQILSKTVSSEMYVFLIETQKRAIRCENRKLHKVHMRLTKRQNSNKINCKFVSLLCHHLNSNTHTQIEIKQNLHLLIQI